MTIFIVITWALLSVIPGAGFLVAAQNLWSVRSQPGSLYPMIYCFANGLYDVFFGVMLLLSYMVNSKTLEVPFIIIWVVLYFPARIMSMTLGLFLSGQINEDGLRKTLSKIIKL